MSNSNSKQSKQIEQKQDKKQAEDELKATSTNPFEGRRRKAHKAWMSVVSEGSLTPEPKD